MLTALSRRLDRLRRSGDAGITLAELMVAMTLTAIVGTMSTSFFVGASHAGNSTIATNQSTADARLTLDNWTGMLRVAGWLDPTGKADRFEEVTPTKIVFYANLANRNTASSVATAPTKVALLLDVTDVATGRGHLVQVVFGSDNTTPVAVRQLALDARARPGSWVFTPYNQTGVAVDTSQPLCLNGSTPAPGLCAKAPTGAGLLDPQLAAGTHQVLAGPLTGDGSADSMLANIGRIDIGFTVQDPSGQTTQDYASSASVSSGFPS